MPTERRFDITAFFHSYSSERIERPFPLGNPVVKSAIFLFSCSLGSRDRLCFTNFNVQILIVARFFLFLARCDRVQLDLIMPDLPDSMTETTENCSSDDNILAVFSNLDADLRSLAPCNPALSTVPEVIFISPPISPVTHLPNKVSDDEPVSLDSTSTIEACDNDPTVEDSSTADGNSSQTAVMSINTSFHPLILFQLIVAPLFRAPISLSTAPRLLIQSIATNITTILLLPNRQQLSDHGSIPCFAMV